MKKVFSFFLMLLALTTTFAQNSEVELKKMGNGGLSGSPLVKNSTEIIRYISNQTQKSIPIIGVGGIMNPKDALDKIQAGAD